MKRIIKTLSVCVFALSIGCEGEIGPAGEQGQPGPGGPQGDPGPQGTTGMDGNDGMDGMNGMDGMDAARFDFRTDLPGAYTSYDRMGMPAVSTALVTDKDAYNDATPDDDMVDNGGLPMFIGEIAGNLGGLHGALNDDLTGASLTPCAPPDGGGFDPVPCATQEIVSGGPTVLNLIVPDTLTVDPTAAAGFPNGRLLADPVMDVTLAIILLDMGTHTPTTLAGLPLNPPANDVPFLGEFPYLAYPHAD